MKDLREEMSLKIVELSDEIQLMKNSKECIDNNTLEISTNKTSNVNTLNPLISDVNGERIMNLEVEHIQTGTFGEISDKKNAFNSSNNKDFEDRLGVIEKEKLNYEQQDMLMKYMKYKITELERLISL